MGMQYINLFHSKALQIFFPNWDFWFENIPSGNPERDLRLAKNVGKKIKILVLEKVSVFVKNWQKKIFFGMVKLIKNTFRFYRKMNTIENMNIQPQASAFQSTSTLNLGMDSNP
jgi:hypothetical protein